MMVKIWKLLLTKSVEGSTFSGHGVLPCCLYWRDSSNCIETWRLIRRLTHLASNQCVTLRASNKVTITSRYCRFVLVKMAAWPVEGKLLFRKPSISKMYFVQYLFIWVLLLLLFLNPRAVVMSWVIGLSTNWIGLGRIELYLYAVCIIIIIIIIIIATT